MYYLLLISVMFFNFCLIKSFILFKSPSKSCGSFLMNYGSKSFQMLGKRDEYEPVELLNCTGPK